MAVKDVLTISFSMGTVGYASLATHLHLIPCVRIHGFIPPLPHVFMTCIGQRYFYHNNSNNL